MVKVLRGKEREIVVNTLNDIADSSGLSPKNKKRFVKFAILWYNANGKKLWADVSYGMSWADRFEGGREYSQSDYTRLAFLVKVDGIKDARLRCAMQMGSYFPGYGVNSPKNAPAREEAKRLLSSHNLGER